MSKHICRSKGRGGKYKAFCGISLNEKGEWASGSPLDCDDKISDREISAATCEECIAEFIEYAQAERKDLSKKNQRSPRHSFSNLHR